MDLFRDGFHLLLSEAERRILWQTMAEVSEDYLQKIEALPVSPQEGSPVNLAAYDFKTPRPPEVLVKEVTSWLSHHLLHTSHPAYYGVFNPAPSTLGVVGELVTACFNPQLASTASAKICIEIESHLIRYFGQKFGYPTEQMRGSFTTGGTEANHTALLCALCKKIPAFRTEGLKDARPVLYTSKETHHSILRAARLCGLGTNAVIALPVDGRLQIDISSLEKQIAEDKKNGKIPLFLVATLGSTSSGTFDPLGDLARVARKEDLWLHSDAAWGGAAILIEEFRSFFAGIELTDSITLDAHKWLSVPMGCGLFLTRHRSILEETFSVDPSPYMPSHTYHTADVEPYKESMQWSRRFIGLKLFLTLAAHGEQGYADCLRHQIKMGHYLRRKLVESQWQIVNDTPFPVVCFVDPKNLSLDVEAFSKKVSQTGRTWITPTKLHHTGQSVLRAGISNFTTQPSHIDTLIEVLDQVRSEGLRR